MIWRNRLCTLNPWGADTQRVRVPDSPSHQRLAQAFSCIQDIQAERDHRGNPRFGKYLEHRLVWRELIELELYELDEHIERMWAAAGVSECNLKEVSCPQNI
jgi:hypothetical protein